MAAETMTAVLVIVGGGLALAGLCGPGLDWALDRLDRRRARRRWQALVKRVNDRKAARD